MLNEAPGNSTPPDSLPPLGEDDLEELLDDDDEEEGDNSYDPEEDLEDEEPLSISELTSGLYQPPAQPAAPKPKPVPAPVIEPEEGEDEEEIENEIIQPQNNQAQPVSTQPTPESQFNDPQAQQNQAAPEPADLGLNNNKNSAESDVFNQIKKYNATRSNQRQSNGQAPTQGGQINPNQAPQPNPANKDSSSSGGFVDRLNGLRKRFRRSDEDPDGEEKGGVDKALDKAEQVKDSVNTAKEVAKQVQKQAIKTVAEDAAAAELGPLAWAKAAYDLYKLTKDLKLKNAWAKHRELIIWLVIFIVFPPILLGTYIIGILLGGKVGSLLDPVQDHQEQLIASSFYTGQYCAGIMQPTLTTTYNGDPVTLRLSSTSGGFSEEKPMEPSGLLVDPLTGHPNDDGTGSKRNPAFYDEYKNDRAANSKNFPDSWIPYYVTMRWPYTASAWSGSTGPSNPAMPKDAFYKKRIVIYNPSTNKAVLGVALEFGPSPNAFDLSNLDLSEEAQQKIISQQKSVWGNSRYSDPTNYLGRIVGGPYPMDLKQTSHSIETDLGITIGEGSDVPVVVGFAPASMQNNAPGPIDCTPTGGSANVDEDVDSIRQNKVDAFLSSKNTTTTTTPSGTTTPAAGTGGAICAQLVTKNEVKFMLGDNIYNSAQATADRLGLLSGASIVTRDVGGGRLVTESVPIDTRICKMLDWLHGKLGQPIQITALIADHTHDGNKSLHWTGNAVDINGPQMKPIMDAVINNASEVKSLGIWPYQMFGLPANEQISGGNQLPNQTKTKDGTNHVHIGYSR